MCWSACDMDGLGRSYHSFDKSLCCVYRLAWMEILMCLPEQLLKLCCEYDVCDVNRTPSGHFFQVL